MHLHIRRPASESITSGLASSEGTGAITTSSVSVLYKPLFEPLLGRFYKYAYSQPNLCVRTCTTTQVPPLPPVVSTAAATFLSPTLPLTASTWSIQSELTSRTPRRAKRSRTQRDTSEPPERTAASGPAPQPFPHFTPFSATNLVDRITKGVTDALKSDLEAKLNALEAKVDAIPALAQPSSQELLKVIKSDAAFGRIYRAGQALETVIPGPANLDNQAQAGSFVGRLGASFVSEVRRERDLDSEDRLTERREATAHLRLEAHNMALIAKHGYDKTQEMIRGHLLNVLGQMPGFQLPEPVPFPDVPRDIMPPAPEHIPIDVPPPCHNTCPPATGCSAHRGRADLGTG